MSSRKSELTLDYDTVLEYIGQFGMFQKKIFFLLWLVSAAGGLAVVVFAFTGYEPNYRCTVSSCEDKMDPSYFGNTDENGMNMLPFWYQNESISLNQRCKVPEAVDGGIDCPDKAFAFTDESKTCDVDNLVFERGLRISTVVEEFQLVCDR